MANGNSDIKLLNEQVKIQGDTEIDGRLEVKGLFAAQIRKLDGWEFLGSPPSIHLVATDLVLHNRSLEESKRNVALSHVGNDNLVINRGKGYTGGVQIQGNTRVDGNLEVQDKIEIVEDSSLVHFPGQKPSHLIIDCKTIKVHNVMVKPSKAPTGGEGGSTKPPEFIDIDLVNEILELKNEVVDLQKRIESLES